jgi:hypothetical protein
MTKTDLRDDASLAAMRLEWWPPSNWNGGRDAIGIGGRLRRNPHQMQRITDARPGTLDKAALARVAPVAYAHVNMRGMFSFSLGALRHRLIEPATDARARQA